MAIGSAWFNAFSSSPDKYPSARHERTTNGPVQFEIAELTRQSVAASIEKAHLVSDQ